VAPKRPAKDPSGMNRYRKGRETDTALRTLGGIEVSVGDVLPGKPGGQPVMVTEIVAPSAACFFGRVSIRFSYGQTRTDIPENLGLYFDEERF